MNAERNAHNGSWVISDVIDGYLVTKRYYGYTKREAISEFRADTKSLGASRKTSRRR